MNLCFILDSFLDCSFLSTLSLLGFQGFKSAGMIASPSEMNAKPPFLTFLAPEANCPSSLVAFLNFANNSSAAFGCGSCFCCCWVVCSCFCSVVPSVVSVVSSFFSSLSLLPTAPFTSFAVPTTASFTSLKLFFIPVFNTSPTGATLSLIPFFSFLTFSSTSISKLSLRKFLILPMKLESLIDLNHSFSFSFTFSNIFSAS